MRNGQWVKGPRKKKLFRTLRSAEGLNMKILILLLALVTSLEANLGVLQIESYARSSGTKVTTQGGDTYFFTISKADFQRINSARKFTGRATHTYDELLTEPYTNREYALDLLLSVRSELIENGEKPTSDQIFIGFIIGMKAFKKLDLNPANVKDKNVLVRLELFRQMESKIEKEMIAANPPPLPTDGRKPVPIRYQTPKNSEHR